jgi:hypothetical protein
MKTGTGHDQSATGAGRLRRFRRELTIGTAIAVIAAVAFGSWFIHRRMEADRRQAQLAHAEREAAHRALLASYQHELPLGRSRAWVKNYLDSKKLPYSEVGDALTVNVATEPGDGFVCDSWTVYVQLKFETIPSQQEWIRPEESPSDKLKSVSLQQIGHCL